MRQPQTKTLSCMVDQLLSTQTRVWELAKNNYQGLTSVVKERIILSNGTYAEVQYNPQRIYSSAAKVDTLSISQRPCFLCDSNRPPQQKAISCDAGFRILVNPFPIFPKHLTIPHQNHIPQRIDMKAMMDLAFELPDFTLFYNGPACGASAPDHMHFQAGNKGIMPIENTLDALEKEFIFKRKDLDIYTINNIFRHCVVIESMNKEKACRSFDLLYGALKGLIPADPEPMMNILVGYYPSGWRILVFPRKLHRPWQFFASGDDNLLLSPASVDMGGLLIVPRPQDAERLTPQIIEDIFAQVSISPDAFQQIISVLATQAC